jgi:hypothetical protein
MAASGKRNSNDGFTAMNLEKVVVLTDPTLK